MLPEELEEKPFTVWTPTILRSGPIEVIAKERRSWVTFSELNLQRIRFASTFQCA